MSEQQEAPVEETGQEEAPVARPRRRWRRRALRAVVAAVLLPPVFGVAAGLLLIGRDIPAPAWLKSTIEATASQLLNGGSLAFGQMRLTIGSDLHLRVHLGDVVFRDAAHTPLARVGSVDALISPRGLILRREVLVQEVALSGGRVDVRRRADGSVAMSFESSGEVVREAESFAELLDRIEGVLHRPELEALETVKASGVIVNYADARAGQSWTVDGGDVALDLRGGLTDLRGEFALLSGRPFVTTVNLRYQSPDDRKSAVFTATVRDAVTGDLASQSPALSWLSVIDAPLTASIRATVLDNGDLGPVNASLALRDGAIHPTEETRPIAFETARTYLTYLPNSGEISFDRVRVDSAWGALDAAGRAWLRDVGVNGMPAAIEGQFTVNNVILDPPDFYDSPQQIDTASADFRLNLAPFALDVGQFYVNAAGQPLNGQAHVTADAAGWNLAVDIASEDMVADGLMTYWPPSIKRGTHKWISENLHDVHLTDLRLGLRLAGGVVPVIAGTAAYDGATIKALKTLPEITGANGFLALADNRLDIVLDQGQVAAPEGGMIDFAGSHMAILDMKQRFPESVITLNSRSSLTAALSLLDLPPFEYMKKANQSIAMATGQAEASVEIRLPLMPKIPPELISYDANAVITGVTSDRLVPGKVLTSPQLDLTASRAGMEITGPVRVGQAAMDATWSKVFSKETAALSTLTADVTVDLAFLDEFNIALPPDMVGGRGSADLRIDLENGKAPAFSITSNLSGVTVSIPAAGHSKGAGTSGEFELSGTLASPPVIDRLHYAAGDLAVDGKINLIAGGGMESAVFDRVRIGNWFDAPVTLTSRGAGRPAAVEVAGGSLDMRRLPQSQGGESGPLTLRLDRLQISDTMALDNMRGQFDSNGGLNGSFDAMLNGTAPVHGQVEATTNGNAVRITADNGGAVISAAGLLQNASGGALELVMIPTGARGSYDASLTMKDLRVREAPVLAALLDAISVIGLLQQMGGQGLLFNDVNARFGITPSAINITQSSAVGVGLGISMDGVYRLDTQEMDFQGVVSPIYLINGIGSILTRRGEGLIGFNYTLTGPKGATRVGVNPLSVLTPGMFREIFRRPPPTQDEQDTQ